MNISVTRQPDDGARQLSASFGQNLTYTLLDELGRTIVTGGYDDRPFPTEADLAKHHR